VTPSAASGATFSYKLDPMDDEPVPSRIKLVRETSCLAGGWSEPKLV